MDTEAIRTVWDSREAVSLRAGQYEALVVPSLGANVLQLLYHDREQGRTLDILRTPDQAQTLLNDPYAYGIPVLFPANRIAGGCFTHDGITYRFPQNYPNGVHIHGVLHGYNWPLAEVRSSPNEAAAVLEASTDDPRLRESFPIDLTIRLECILSRDGLLQRFILDNRSPVTMPFGVAYHTAFRASLNPWGRTPVPVGAYLYVQPGDRSFLGGGLAIQWFREATRAVRDHIACQGGRWQSIITAPAFLESFGQVQGERLRKVPAGYEPDHPQGDSLRQKSWTITAPLPDSLFQDQDGLTGRILALCREMAPFQSFLNEALQGLQMPEW